jgi:hypothetical protein
MEGDFPERRLDQSKNTPRGASPKPLKGDLRSGTGLKGLPADRESAPKGEGFGVLMSAAGAINPFEEISAPYPYSAFDNDVRNFAGLDHLVGLAPSETDHPGNVTDAVKQLFNVACESSHGSAAFLGKKLSTSVHVLPLSALSIE